MKVFCEDVPTISHNPVSKSVCMFSGLLKKTDLQKQTHPDCINSMNVDRRENTHTRLITLAE